MSRKIVMRFPLGGEPTLEHTDGFGRSCEEHIEQVARLAGAKPTLVCPLPDLEKVPVARVQNDQQEQVY